MARFLKLSIGVILAFFLSGCSVLQWWSGEETGQQVALAVLHVNDTHAHLEATPAAMELAGGGDGYSVLGQATGYRYNTGFGDADVFMEYVQVHGSLHRPESFGVEYVPR